MFRSATGGNDDLTGEGSGAAGAVIIGVRCVECDVTSLRLRIDGHG
jgi:hypothetical protein